MASAPDERSETERRVDELGRDAFQLAVRVAATQATQAVARIHRRQLIAQTALVVALAVLGILLPVSYVLYRNEVDTTHTNALSNCRLAKGLSAAMVGFVQSDASLRYKQAALGREQRVVIGFARLFPTAYLRYLEQRQAALDTAAFTYWRHTTVPQLRAIANANCATRVK